MEGVGQEWEMGKLGPEREIGVGWRDMGVFRQEGRWWGKLGQEGETGMGVLGQEREIGMGLSFRDAPQYVNGVNGLCPQLVSQRCLCCRKLLFAASLH